MYLSEESIVEFKKLYFQEYKEEISDDQAMEYGIRLVRFVQAVYGDDLPSPKFDKNYKKFNN